MKLRPLFHFVVVSHVAFEHSYLGYVKRLKTNIEWLEIGNFC